jgi:hypothetical protein
MKSIFLNKETEPTKSELEKALKDTLEIWLTLVDFTKELYPDVKEKWHYTSEKYGWSFRMSDKKRVILYLLPRDKFFKTAFVFGQKATNEILASSISDHIKNEIRSAEVYAEGRGFRIGVTDKSNLDDIRKLIKIKIEN